MADQPKKPLELKKLDPEVRGTFLPREGTKRSYRAEGLARLMPKVTRKIAGKRPTLLGDLQAAWADVVGQELARFTRPVRISAQTLHLEIALGAGPGVAMHQDDMLAKIALYLGGSKVKRLRLSQVDFPLPDVRLERGRQTARPQDTPQETVEAAQAPLTNAPKGASKPSDVGEALERLRQRLQSRKDLSIPPEGEEKT